MTEINSCFSTPSSRLQLLMFMNVYTSQEPFQTAASVLSTHPLMSSVLKSLLLDDSSTVCSTGLTLLVKLLPIFAVHACKELQNLLPQLLVVLVRVICWKERPFSSLHSSISPGQLDDISAAVESDLGHELRDDKPLHVRPDLGWDKLESTFGANATSAPSPRAFFTIIYYLFPITTLRFLKEPAKCLAEHGFPTPYTVSWEQAVDEVQIRSKSEVRCLSSYYIILLTPYLSPSLEVIIYTHCSFGEIFHRSSPSPISGHRTVFHG